MHASVPARPRRRAAVSVKEDSKTLMLGLARSFESTLEGDRQSPWIWMLGCRVRRELVIRRAILPVKPVMAIFVTEDMLMCVM